MQKKCRVSGQEFEITDSDLKFYEKMDVPPPTLCVAERHRRRMAFRNERSMYRRKCDLCEKSIVSIYSPDKKCPVFCQECWWSDKWNPKMYGQDYDFSRPFFEQFQEVYSKTPQLASISTGSENCDFSCFAVDSKNCYLSQRAAHAEDVLYCYLPIRSRDCVDCYNISDCELCYEVTDGDKCYDVRFSQNVVSCRESSFLFNCRNCTNCFFCANLRNKEYYFCNEKCSKEEYLEKVGEFKDLSFSQKEKIIKDFIRLKSQQIVPAFWGNLVENVVGNYIFGSKNAYDTFDVRGVEDISYSWGHTFGKDSLDTSFCYYCDNAYEMISGSQSSYLKFCFHVHAGCSDMEYSISCVNNCKHCFGCVSLRHGEYCLLNKQYSKQEYEDLRTKVIEHMKSTGEWGEFFPINASAFAYNETIANEYFPLTKEEAKKRGYAWKEEDKRDYQEQKITIPEKISDTDDSICNDILACENCKKNYSIQRPEFSFYENQKLPIPHKCPDCRYALRVELRNPRRLFERNCAKCNKNIQTSFAKDRPEKVYCEDCYTKEVN